MEYIETHGSDLDCVLLLRRVISHVSKHRNEPYHCRTTFQCLTIVYKIRMISIKVFYDLIDNNTN